MFPQVRFQLEVVDECFSSQQLLLDRRGQVGFHGSAILALRQTAGYGRRGRSWESLEGNLALSLALELQDESALSLLPFVCGIALYSTTLGYVPSGIDLRLKWPNDLYLNRSKLAGILTQVRQIPGRMAEVVVGVGLNLRSAPQGLPQSAVALAEFIEPPSPENFARSFLSNLESVFGEAKDFSFIRTNWERAARLEECPLYILGEREPLFPEALLVTGELAVNTKEGEKRVLASEEVSLRYVPTVPFP